MIRLVKLLFLLLPLSSLQAGQVDTVLVHSAAMGRDIPCLVIRPDAYRTEGEGYPVVYLLHGHGGTYRDWILSAPQLPETADRYGMLIVCPDGGWDSWYFDSPVDLTVRYETHVAVEVVTYIDAHYHTLATASRRAVSGLSMGGHGALWLAARHPEVFGAAGSMAGGVDLMPYEKNRWGLQAVLGDYRSQHENWAAGSVVNQIDRFQQNKQALLIDCGLDDFFLEVNRDLRRRLLAAGVPHEYTERPGAHNQAYWGSAVDFHLLFFSKFFRSN